MEGLVWSLVIILSSGQESTVSQNEGTENSHDGIDDNKEGDSHEPDIRLSIMTITTEDDTEPEEFGSDKHTIAEEMMSRQAHGCPGPPVFQTDLRRSNVTDVSRHQTILQTELQTARSDPPGIQGGFSESNSTRRTVPVLYPPNWRTLSDLQSDSKQYNQPSRTHLASVSGRSDPSCVQASISKEHQYWEPPYRQTGHLLSGVQEQSVPEQDQLISVNDYKQQRKVRGVKPENYDDKEELLKSHNKEKEEESVTSEHIKDGKGKQSEKHVKFSEDVKIEKSDDSFNDVKDFIKQLLKQEIKSKKSDIKRLCDAVIVYDKNDYTYAADMRDEIKAIVAKELNEELRIELFDDENFTQSHVQVVQDVLKNASVVLVYLSKNTDNSRQVQFFIEEAVALTRIGTINKDALVSDCEFSVRPVHTQPSNQRNYRTPPGLASVSGIDWYDKSKYTYDKIVAIMKNAIRRKKRIENPRQVQDEFRESMLRPGSFPQQQHHRRDEPQHLWVSGASAFTTSGPRYTPQATTELSFRGINEPTQHGFNINDAESMMRRISLEPNQGSAGYTQGGDYFVRTGEGHIQPENRFVYANVNTSFTPYAEPVAPFDVPQNLSRPTLDPGYRAAEESEFRGYHRMGQFSRVGEQGYFPRHSQKPLNEQPQNRREGRDEINIMGLANDGQRINTSRTNFRSAEEYSALNEPRQGHSTMNRAPGVRQQRPTEYSPGPLQHHTHQQRQQQQQQPQPRDQTAMYRGIRSYEMLDSNLSTNDVEIDNPISKQESRRTYDQGLADNAGYTDDSDSSEDELWDPLANHPGSNGGRVVNIVGSKILQIGDQNSVTNVRNIVKKDRKHTKEKKTRLKDKESNEDEPKKHLAELDNNTENESKPAIRSKDIKHPSIPESLSQKLVNETKQSNVAKSGNDLSDPVNLVCKHNDKQKTNDDFEQPAKNVVSGYELNIPFEEPRVHANIGAKGVEDVGRYIHDENTRLTATVSYPDLQKMSQSPRSHEKIAGDGGSSVLLLSLAPNAIDHSNLRAFTNTVTDPRLISLDENTEEQKLNALAWTEAVVEKHGVFTSDDISDANLLDEGRHDRQNVGRTLFTSRSATSFSDLVNRSLVIEDETCDPANVSDVD